MAKPDDRIRFVDTNVLLAAKEANPPKLWRTWRNSAVVWACWR